MLAHKPGDLVRSGQHDQAFYQRMWDAILSGQKWQGEVVSRREDGSLHHESVTISPVTNSDGVIQHFIAIKQDIIERKVAAE